MPPSPARAERRRPRRGSLERPVDGRLYRSAFLLVALPLLILAFSITRPTPLSAPPLPPSFDGPATRALAVDLSGIPARPPGSAGALAAANWFRDQIAPYGLPITADTWQQDVPGLGRVRLQNLWAVARGRSADAIVVMAHRDNTGIGQGANDDASGTAALVELARSYAETSNAQPGTPAPQSVRPVHTLVFLSTDGGSFGGLGAARFVQHLPFHVVATVNLTAIAGRGPPRIVIAGDTPRSPAATLVETAAKRVLEQTGTGARRTSVLGQLLDLAFPLTFYEQGPFVTHGIPAVTLTTAGQRPPDAFTDRPSSLDGTRLAGVGRSAQQLLGSLDQGLELTQGTTSFVWAGARVVRGWAIELLLAALLIPFFVAAVDLFAHCRRRRIPLRPAVAALRSRLGFWLFVGLSFYGFRALGAWPGGPDRPPSPASAAAGNWPVVAVITLGALLGVGWMVARHRLVPRRVVGPDELLAGETVGLLALGLVSLLVLATNPFALVFVLPALHAWLWLPQVRSGRGPARVVVFAIGLAGPVVLLGSLAIRFGLGFDAPWYLLQLANVGYVSVATVAIMLAAGACAAQLAAATAGRYAPYPTPRERPPRGPLRGLVRAIILAKRARQSSKR
jgi:Peptidase family M28